MINAPNAWDAWLELTQKKEKKKTKIRTSRKAGPILPQWPVWYFPDAPLGSAVKYIASLSPRWDWVGIYILKHKAKRKEFVLGPFIGVQDISSESDQLISPLRSAKLTVPIQDRNDKIIGQLCLGLQFEGPMSPEEEKDIRRVALELGLWGAEEFKSERVKR